MGQDLVPSTSSDMDAETDAARLFEELYVELRRLAAGCMRGQSASHTLQTTALIGEAYLRLAREQGGRWRTKGHFMAVAARAMRSVLVDHARTKKASKRSADGVRIHLEGLMTSIESRSAGILDLDQALTKLEAMGASGERAVHVVELRFLCGLTMPEIADALGAGENTVRRDWDFARAWLAHRLQ